MKKDGPFKILVDLDEEMSFRESGFADRNDQCENYQTCLEIAAALNWNDFSCRSCSGRVNSALYWRALHRIKKDSLAKELCKELNISSVINPDYDEVA